MLTTPPAESTSREPLFNIIHFGSLGTGAYMASAGDIEAAIPPVPPAPGATVQQAVSQTSEKPVKGGAGKDQLAEVKAVVLNAMATKDADNAILLQRIQQRFERC